ncbi:hypothetical protein [Clostridium sp. Marseille-P299]|uniref:hypothetical protein n=1 Tax=Clostridium sp. Marseille-P299 TaxID=1805477 RepID=UPI00082CEBF2|nr:hypothetical protein [Clostridium sp. Marseille-P299]
MKRKQLRRKMVGRIRRYENDMPSMETYLEKEYLDKDNNAIIRIYAYEGMEWFDKLSTGNQATLNQDIYDFIDRKAYYIPIRYPIIIQFENVELNEEEQHQIIRLIKEYYALNDKRIDLHFNFITILSLFTLGIILLIIYFTMNTAEVGAIFSEVLSIAASFALWEAVDFFLLERKSISKERWNAGQLTISEIRFIAKEK